MTTSKFFPPAEKFDIDNDPRIRDLTKDGGIAKEIPVEQFDKETVRTLTVKLGIDPKTLSPKQHLASNLSLLSCCR